MTNRTLIGKLEVASVLADFVNNELLPKVGLDKDKTSQKVGASSAEAIDFLDVPTFMRKQVD